MTPPTYALRAATESDWEGLHRLLALAFNEEWEEDGIEVERRVFEPARTVLAERDSEIVGTSAAFTRDLTVPGAVLPSAHVSMVAVSPTHRRQGLLTAMMNELFTQARAAGEPVAHLWASEGVIYQRFGYGMAAQRASIDAPREVQLREPPRGHGSLRQIRLTGTTPDELPIVYEQTRASRPGWSSRDERWWDRTVADPKSWRDGATSLRVTVHEGQSGVDGYALWRVRNDFNGGLSVVLVREVVAANEVAYQALWHFLLNVDLTRACRLPHGAIDEPLAHLVNQPRLLNQKLGDSLWVRLVDVPEALARRRYPVPVDVTLSVTDPLLPANTGTWRLTGGPDGASCTRTEAPADLRVDIGALGAAYLGGSSLGTLAAAGRVTERTPGTLAPTSAAFGWHRAPSALEVF